MANEGLVKYIKDQTKAGYDITQIRSSLISRGYSAASVDAAVKEAKPKLPLMWIAIALIVLVIIVLTVLVYMKMQAPEEKLLAPLEKIKITEKEEAKEIPAEKEEIDLEKIPVPPAEKIPMIETEAKQEFESSMKIEQIREVSLREPDRAEALCGDLSTKTEKDNCYATIAQAASKPDFCGKISEQTIRDQCYFNFAVLGYKTCSSIKSNLTRKSCTELQSLNITSR